MRTLAAVVLSLFVALGVTFYFAPPSAEAASTEPMLLPASAPPTPLREGLRNRVAQRWAPTFFQETADRRDLIAPFDFDGDWDGSNNGANINRYPLRAVVYFTVVETPTHFFVTYVPYHAVDSKGLAGHDHDTEHVTLVVRRDGSEFGRVEAMETRFHKVMYQYAAPGARVANRADDVDGPIHVDGEGRPQVYAQRVGHGLCGGFSPTSWPNFLALTCHHGEVPHIKERGVVYHFSGTAEVPRSIDDRNVGYALEEIGDTLWAHAHDKGPHATFASLMSFEGERCGPLFICPRAFGAVLSSRRGHGSTGMPWEEGSGRGMSRRGEAFFDPAYTLSRRLAFPAPFATNYVYNPYLSVGTFDDAG